MKRGLRKTAEQLTHEANITEDKEPPINADHGLLYECVVLCLFYALISR
jgi:hypothetical protein